MICKQCGAQNPDAKRVCTECGAFLEGYTFNNVTGDYGYRGADGEWYKTEEDYRARCHDQGDWQPMNTYNEGDRVTYGGIEYVLRDGKFVPVNKLVRKRSWLERWHDMIPFVIIIIDIAVMSWASMKYWAIIFPYFDLILYLNVLAVILFTIFVMIGVETYIENKKKQ